MNCNHIYTLYHDAYSCGNNAMWLERFNSKAEIVTGCNKYKSNTDGDTTSCVVNVATNAPDLLDYDIRQPALKFAHQTVMQPINTEKAMKQSWYNGIFPNDDKNRKNEYFEKKMTKYFATNSLRNDDNEDNDNDC